MPGRSRTNKVQARRQEVRLQAIARSAARRRELTAAQKLDVAEALIRDARSLHDAATGTLARRRH